jgi:hypothetical protein
MRFRLLWTIMVDHRLPKIRAVDLRRQSGSAFFGLAGELGFEPRQTESESVVLPLHHSPIITQ